jgi:hypothetical protein
MWQKNEKRYCLFGYTPDFDEFGAIDGCVGRCIEPFD